MRKKRTEKKERQKQRRIEEIEERIAVVEDKLGENEQLLCDPDIFQDHEKVQAIQTENDTLNQELESLLRSGKSCQKLKECPKRYSFSFKENLLSTMIPTITS